eukprot:c4382_g2_i1.p1 GENE.c4382_g2_i1~~c4382_g2_i1.p1  ORF type:complete len:700 (+),score=113.77 c4382_g2_i1:673-2772(+)
MSQRSKKKERSAAQTTAAFALRQWLLTEKRGEPVALAIIGQDFYKAYPEFVPVFQGELTKTLHKFRDVFEVKEGTVVVVGELTLDDSTTPPRTVTPQQRQGPTNLEQCWSNRGQISDTIVDLLKNVTLPVNTSPARIKAEVNSIDNSLLNALRGHGLTTGACTFVVRERLKALAEENLDKLYEQPELLAILRALPATPQLLLAQAVELNVAVTDLGIALAGTTELETTINRDKDPELPKLPPIRAGESDEDRQRRVKWAEVTLACKDNDYISGFRCISKAYDEDHQILQTGKVGEEAGLKDLRMAGVTFKTQEDLQRDREIRTPDAVFEQPVQIFARDVNWVEVKASVVIPGLSPQSVVNRLKDQVRAYEERYGPGCILWAKERLFYDGWEKILGANVAHFGRASVKKKQPIHGGHKQRGARRGGYTSLYSRTAPWISVDDDEDLFEYFPELQQGSRGFDYSLSSRPAYRQGIFSSATTISELLNPVFGLRSRAFWGRGQTCRNSELEQDADSIVDWFGRQTIGQLEGTAISTTQKKARIKLRLQGKPDTIIEAPNDLPIGDLPGTVIEKASSVWQVDLSEQRFRLIKATEGPIAFSSTQTLGESGLSGSVLTVAIVPWPTSETLKTMESDAAYELVGRLLQPRVLALVKDPELADLVINILLENNPEDVVPLFSNRQEMQSVVNDVRARAVIRKYKQQ